MFRQPGALMARNLEPTTIPFGRVLSTEVAPTEGDQLIGVEFNADDYGDTMSMVSIEEIEADGNGLVVPIHEGVHTVEVNVPAGVTLHAGLMLWLSSEGKLTTIHGYGARLPIGICIDPDTYVVGAAGAGTDIHTKMATFKVDRW